MLALAMLTPFPPTYMVYSLNFPSVVLTQSSYTVHAESITPQHILLRLEYLHLLLQASGFEVSVTPLEHQGMHVHRSVVSSSSISSEIARSLGESTILGKGWETERNKRQRDYGIWPFSTVTEYS